MHYLRNAFQIFEIQLQTHTHTQITRNHKQQILESDDALRNSRHNRAILELNMSFPMGVD